jgi:hypothetical protein
LQPQHLCITLTGMATIHILQHKLHIIWLYSDYDVLGCEVVPAAFLSNVTVYTTQNFNRGIVFTPYHIHCKLCLVIIYRIRYR